MNGGNDGFHETDQIGHIVFIFTIVIPKVT